MGKTDKIIVEEIIKNDLGVRDVKIEEVIRLGVGKEPWPILLKLNDTQTQIMVLSKAKNLKHADTETCRNICTLFMTKHQGRGKVSGVAKGTKGEKEQRRNGPYDQRHESSETYGWGTEWDRWESGTQ